MPSFSSRSISHGTKLHNIIHSFASDPPRFQVILTRVGAELVAVGGKGVGVGGEVMWWVFFFLSTIYFKASCLLEREQSSLVKEERFDAPGLEFW